jgi:hypothetical protein
VDSQNIDPNIQVAASPAMSPSSSKTTLASASREDYDDQGDMFKPYANVYMRYPEIGPPGGIRLLKRIVGDYGVKGLCEVTIPWHDPATGMANFKPHPNNVREQRVVEAQYEESIKQNGIMACARGAPFALQSDTPTGRPYLLISWGTLSRCFYRVLATDGDNPNVKESLRIGVEGVTILHQRTPTDCFDWIQQMHNHDTYTRGSSITFKQSLERVAKVEANWDAFADLHGYTSRTPKLSSIQMDWLSKNTDGEYVSANAYEACKITKNHLLTLGCFDTFISFLGASVDFRAVSNNVSVLLNLHAFATSIMKFTDAWPKDLLALAFMEGSKFLCPCKVPKRTDGFTDTILVEAAILTRMPAMSFYKFKPDALKWVCTDISESVTCKKKANEKEGADDDGEDSDDLEEQEEAPAKKRRAPKAKAKAKAKSKCEPVLPTVETLNGTSRCKMWLDDLLAVATESFVDDARKVLRGNNNVTSDLGRVRLCCWYGAGRITEVVPHPCLRNRFL